jgi:hypothetical protein
MELYTLPADREFLEPIAIIVIDPQLLNPEVSEQFGKSSSGPKANHSSKDSRN